MNEKTKAVLPLSIENADGSITVKLKEPISFGDERIEELKFIKPKAKHIKSLNLKDMKMSDVLGLMSVLSGQFPQALDELGMHDVTFCTAVIERFFLDTAAGGRMG